MNQFYEIQFEIETACLLDCIHCSSASSRSLAKRLYSDEDILRMLELFQGETRVVFTGGEPLLYNHIFELCKQISLKSPLSDIEIYTTGNVKNMNPIDELMANQLKASQVHTCYFSIYSISTESHDRWTQRGNSFFNTIESVSSLKKVGISPKAHLVLTRENINCIQEIICFCKSIGMDEVRILKLTPTGNAKINWENISILPSAQDDIVKQVVSHQKDFGISITVAGYPRIMPCRNFPNAKGCQAGINLLYVDSFGDIYPCACAKSNPMNFKICNIKELKKLKQYLETTSTLKFHQECINSKC